MNLPLAIAGTLGVAAMVLDVGWRRIPNWLVAAGAASGLLSALPQLLTKRS